MKQNRKKWTVLLVMLILCFSFGMIRAEDSALTPPFKDKDGNPIKLSWFAELHAPAAALLKNRGEGEVWKYWEDQYGLDIQWEHPSGNLDDAFNLMIASGVYPDIIEYGNWKNYPGGPDQAIADGIIVDLTQYVEQYCPNLMAYFEKDPLARYQLTSSDGKIWAFSKIFPNEDPWFGICIRQDLLNRFGLDMPQTIDDWYNVLSVFKENGVESPLNFQEEAFTTYGTFIGAWGILRNFYVADDHTVHYGPIEDAYRDFLSTMNKWYEEGLIDKEFASMDNSARDAKNLTGTAGAWTGSVAEQVGTYNAAMSKSDDDYLVVGAPYPKLHSDDGPTRFRQYSFPVRNYYVAISTSCKYVKEICMALDWMIGKEGSFTCTFGFENVSYTLDGKGDPHPTALLTDDPAGNPVANMMAKYAMRYGPFLCDKREAYFIADNDVYLAAQKTWADSASADGILPPYTLTAEESLEFAGIMAETKTYMDEMYLKFVIGLEPLDGYEDYVKNIQGMGIERALEIQNAAYQRYLASTGE